VEEQRDSLVILWATGDRDVALYSAFMYGLNSKLRGWWDDVTLIVWGSSSKLLANDIELQEHVTTMIEAGVVVEACKSCSDHFGVSGTLSNLGVDVKGMGEPLTSYLKEGRHVLTY